MDSLGLLNQEQAPPDGGSTASPTSSEPDERAHTETSSEPFSVGQVLGREIPPAAVPRSRRALQAAVASVGSALAVLARPRVAGVLVFGLGVILLFLLGYIYVFTPLTAQRAQHGLFQSITADPAKTFSLAEGKIPAEGSPVAVLEIPALHLVEAVVQGSDAQDLRTGPGHMPTTPMPGQTGNAVIVGRRATFGAPFGAIGTIKKGAMVKVVDGYGTFRYRVARVVYAEGGRHDVVNPTAANRLTLVTASSGVFPTGRLAVVSKLVGQPFTAAPEPRFHPVPAELGLEGDPASGLLAVLWGALFFVLLSGTAWLLRTWDQPVVVLLLASPLLVIVALFTCESVIGFLPATV